MTPVSVVICTRDRPDDLARCLPTVLASDYPDFEVVVVDQSASDASERIVAAIADPRLNYRRQHGAGKGRALNAALAQTEGDVLAHTDDDCTVPPEWLRRATSVLADEPEAGIVFGALDSPPIDWDEMFVPTFQPPSYRRLQGRFAFVRVPRIGVGANMCVRRNVYERLGGFDEFMGPGSRFRSGDEWDLAYRAMKAGFAVVQDPSNVVVHWGRRSYADGSARRILRNKYYGVGAGFVKHLRCGDPLAAYALLQLALRDTVYLAGNLVRLRRQTGAARLLYLALGVVRGLRQPIDRRHWLFVPAGHERA